MAAWAFALVSLLLVGYGAGWRILGVFPTATRSHYKLDYKLMKGLADEGHNVTILSTMKQKTPPKTKGKFVELVFNGFLEANTKAIDELNLFDKQYQKVLTLLYTFIELHAKPTNRSLHHRRLHELIGSNQKFDGVIIDYVYNDALRVLAYIFKCPIIVLSHTAPNLWINAPIGNPDGLSFVPNIWIGGSEQLTFLERVENFIHFLNTAYFKYWETFPVQDEIIQKSFPGAPSVQQLTYKTSLQLINTHVSMYPPQPKVPNMIEIGGYHIDEVKALPTDLTEFLDSATDGAIYFSMGSILKSKDMSMERKKTILNAFSQLKQKVIWKYEDEPPDLPKNVMIKKWVPQTDLLAHRRIRLFISHCGTLSVIEALFNSVPIFCIPVFGDQFRTAQKIVYDGYGHMLEYHDAEFDVLFKKFIDEMIHSPAYKKRALLQSVIFRDRLGSPLQWAVFWVEYTIRHKGAKHLRVANIQQPWYEFVMLDVLTFLTVVLVLALYAIPKFIAFAVDCFKKLTSKKPKKTKIKSKPKKAKKNN